MNKNANVELRRALGQFATGICVVCCEHEGVSYGMTINSFSSVSLEPALILWSIKVDSYCFGIFSKAEKFSINILSASQSEIAKEYAKRGDHVANAAHTLKGFQGIPYIDQSICTFFCEKWRVVGAGDHDILISLILHWSSLEHSSPAIFYKGAYYVIEGI